MLSTAAAGEFRPCLLQARLSATRICSGARSLEMTYWWMNAGDAEAEAEECVFVHVRREGEKEDDPAAIRLGADHRPPIPTQRWRPGRVVTYASFIALDKEMPPGKYVVLAGMYDPGGGGRRELDGPPLLPDDDRRYLIARFEIVPEGTEPEAEPETVTFSPLPPVNRQPDVPQPEEVVTIGGGPLKLTLDRFAPRIVGWSLEETEFAGDAELWEPEVRVLSLKDNRVRLTENRDYRLYWSGHEIMNGVVYKGSVSKGTDGQIKFSLTFLVVGSRAEISLHGVREEGDCRLVSVRLGRVVSAGSDGTMALPWNGGRLVRPGTWQQTIFGGGLGWGTQMMAAVLCNSQVSCAADLSSIDSRLVLTRSPAGLFLGASLEHCTPANSGVPPLQLGRSSTLRLHFQAPGNRAPTWMDGARLLRKEVTARPPKIYDDTLIYKIFCDSPGSEHYTTFAQALDLVRRYSNLIDRAPQIAYLVGWQHEGHDTGYPDVFTVNQRLGGRGELLAAMEKAKQYNAVLSFHDNYDDAYKESPSWNPKCIARDRAGNLQKGRVWAGGQSYIQSFSEAATREAVRRVRRTLGSFPIRTSYHIDVLSAMPGRLDFSSEHPASMEDSLAGKKAIVAAFNEAGVDVTSEGMCSPFVGVVGHAWHLIRRDHSLFPNEEHIPFVPFVYHGHATYGGARPTDEDIPEALLYGATFSADFNRSTSRKELTDSYYLLTVPFLALRNREMTDYHADGNLRRASYGPDTFVEADGKHYRVVVDGRQISTNFTSFAPNWRGDAWLAYSRDGAPLEVAAPAGWNDARRIHAVALTPEGPGAEIPVTLVDGRLHLTIAAATPCRLSYL